MYIDNFTYKEKMKKLLENKKMSGICGGVAGVLVVAVIVIAIVAGSKESTKEASEKETKKAEAELTTELTAKETQATSKPTQAAPKSTQAQVVTQPATTLSYAQKVAQAPVISNAETKKLIDNGGETSRGYVDPNATYQLKTPTTREIVVYDKNNNMFKTTVKDYYYYDQGSPNVTFEDEGIDADGDGIEESISRWGTEVQRDWEIATFGRLCNERFAFKDFIIFNCI